MTTKPIRILIADDHAIVRKGLRALMETRDDIDVVGEAADGEEAIAQAKTLVPDVVLLDLIMPRKDGIETIRQIKQEQPDARILVLTSFAEDDKVLAAIKAGALGYLLKDSMPQDLVKAIHAVHRGEPSLDPAIALQVIREMNQPTDLPPAAEPLTERELEVLKLVAQGFSNQDIARQLSINERTVGTHVSNILSKLHLANRTQAALYALREGLTKLD